eukprot:scpid28345/ scgid35228/ Tetratricopeptide repeat protein 26
MLMSRSKPDPSANGGAGGTERKVSKAGKKKQKSFPKLMDFIEGRDYTGAVTLLEFQKSLNRSAPDQDLWLAYAYFHLTDYAKALKIYEDLLAVDAEKYNNVYVNIAACQFFLGNFAKAEEAGKKAPDSPLKFRTLFHIAGKTSEEATKEYHQRLRDVVEDQLSLAAIHYLRGHHQEAIDIYKKLLLQKARDYWALHVYVALCYYKLDYYDVAAQVLSQYLSVYPDSATAINLKACTFCRLYNGKAGEAELRVLDEQASSSFKYAQDLVKHNLVVFRGGEGALQVLPPLIDIIPEARLNLVIYHLKNDNYQQAYDLIKDVEAGTPSEYVLKGVANAALGQEIGSRELSRTAQQYFQLVGGSASECDTIPGRQCMASCFFLMNQFPDVLVYLTSVKTYIYTDDSFNFNFGQAKAQLGQYKEAEEYLMAIQAERIKSDYVYTSWLARCHIMNQKPSMAWDLYMKMDTSQESFSLLTLIATDCYRTGQFYYSAKAFDVLDRIDGTSEYWEGKRGACIGVFQMIIAQRESRDTLKEVIRMLRQTNNQQVEYIVRIMIRWAKANVVPLDDAE